EPGTQAAAEPALVQEASEMAHRLRRPHQCSQTATWVAAIAVSRAGRHPALGRTGRDRRQRHSHRYPLGRASTLAVKSPLKSDIPLSNSNFPPLTIGTRISSVPITPQTFHNLAVWARAAEALLERGTFLN